jgi:uncharacterized membrane protein (GlpM family)
MNDAEALRSAIAVSMVTLIPALIFMYLAQKHLPKDEATRLERAAALGKDTVVTVNASASSQPS